MKIQPDSFSCGVYAVMNAARALGVFLKRKDIIKYSKTTKQGTTEKGVIRALEKLKFCVDTFCLPYISAFPNLQNLLRRNNPVIIYLPREEHWCTVIGMIGDNFILFDSDMDLENKKEHGTQIVKENELVERWANYKNFYGIRVSLRKRRNNNR